MAVRDAAGRSVTVAAPSRRVFPAGPPAGMVLYSIAPQAMLGWSTPPGPKALPFLGPGADLPALGRLTGRGGEANVETVLRLKTDLIVDLGMTSGTYVSLAERVQQATGIPYLLLDGALDALPATYRLLGPVLGAAEAGEARADFIARHLAAISDTLRDVPQDRRPRVYLARGARGLESARAGSINVEAVERAGGRNVVGEAMGPGALVAVSMEQVLAFDPDVIIVLDPDFFARMAADPLWAQLRAVRTGRAVLAPQLPFPWVDYPPSVNRVMGVIWLAQLFFPDRFAFNVRVEAREFYKLFYHRALEEAELDALLAHAWFR